MALELVTGYWGQQHVTAEQDADLNAGIIGREPCILRVGENMRAEAVTANKVRIFDGIFVGYGRVCAIDEGAYEDVEIENGTAGLLRNDMIVIKYVKDEATCIEGVRLAVLKGLTGSTATDPTPNNQDIRAGAFESEMPLYRVRLNGLAIEAVERICEMPRTIKDLTSLFGQLNSNIEIKVVNYELARCTYSSGNVYTQAGRLIINLTVKVNTTINSYDEIIRNLPEIRPNMAALNFFDVTKESKLATCICQNGTVKLIGGSGNLPAINDAIVITGECLIK